MVAEAKERLRKEMLAKRNALQAYEMKAASAEVEHKLFETAEFQSAKTVAFYLAKDSELSTFRMLDRAAQLGKKVLVPVTDTHIRLVEYTGFNDLERGKFNVPEPKTKIPFTVVPDLIIIPGVAFDLDCHRLGYGKGYYDVFLKGKTVHKIGICYDFQIVEKLPRHDHDVRLDSIITDKRII
ncbi:MAG: 5-formyltetrahydrofolate cyclo-ligase [Candidatus Bilamarchaeaceae archaeon]